MLRKDVSAIVNPADVDNVSELYPKDHPSTPVSGCRNFPCNHVYYAPNDVQTQATTQSHLVCTLGINGIAAKRSDDDYAASEPVKRDFVLGKYF